MRGCQQEGERCDRAHNMEDLVDNGFSAVFNVLWPQMFIRIFLSRVIFWLRTGGKQDDGFQGRKWGNHSLTLVAPGALAPMQLKRRDAGVMYEEFCV